MIYFLSISIKIIFLICSGTSVVVIVWQLELQLPVQSMPITTNVVSSNPSYGEVYSIQLYVIKFVSYLRQVGGFLRVLRFPPPMKMDDKTKINGTQKTPYRKLKTGKHEPN